MRAQRHKRIDAHLTACPQLVARAKVVVGLQLAHSHSVSNAHAVCVVLLQLVLGVRGTSGVSGVSGVVTLGHLVAGVVVVVHRCVHFS
jgi:hypothetical protein